MLDDGSGSPFDKVAFIQHDPTNSVDHSQKIHYQACPRVWEDIYHLGYFNVAMENLQLCIIWWFYNDLAGSF